MNRSHAKRPFDELWLRAQHAWDAGRRPSEDEAFLEHLVEFPELAADSTDLADILRLETRVDQLERAAHASPRGWPLFAAACAAALVALLAFTGPDSKPMADEPPAVATHAPEQALPRPASKVTTRTPTLVGYLEVTTSHEAFGQRTPRTIRSHTSRRTLRSPRLAERP